MAKVFSRQISILGKQIDNYIETPRDREAEFKPLRRQLQQLNGEFKRFLGRSFTPKTVRKHSGIIAIFIDFLEWNTDVTSIDDITRGIANVIIHTPLRKRAEKYITKKQMVDKGR